MDAVSGDEHRSNHRGALCGDIGHSTRQGQPGLWPCQAMSSLGQVSRKLTYLALAEYINTAALGTICACARHLSATGVTRR